MQDENSEPQKDSDEPEVTGEFMPDATGEYQADNEATRRFLPGQSTDFRKIVDGLTIRINASHAGETQPEVTDEVETESNFGEYRLEHEIARGGMGVVFRATQTTLNRPVALKMILAGQLASDVEVRRFYTEAEAAAKLDHPNIVPIYDIGQQNETHYFSMKLIEGSDLSKKLPEIRNDLKLAISMLEKVCRGVDHAHQRAVLHRDLKPANILIDQDGEPYITDLGLARSVGKESNITRTGAIVGTPSYMSPEQAAGEAELTTASDVYSLGAILYEILTGAPPFRGKTPMDTLMQVINSDPIKPSASSATDRNLELIALKCLAKNPGERYRSASDLADDLGRWLRGEPLAIRAPTVSALARNWMRQNFGRAIWILVVGMVGGLVAGFGLWNATIQREITNNFLYIYEQLPNATAPSVWFTWTTPYWLVLPSLILFITSLALLGFFTAWLVQTKNTSADIAAGLAVGIIAGSAAFFYAFATMSISATTDKGDLNLLGLLGSAPLDETPLLLLDSYPEMESLSRDEQISLLKLKISVDQTFAVPRGLTLATIACFALFVVAGIAETVIAGRAVRKQERLTMALTEYLFCSLPYVTLSTFLGIHLAVALIFGSPGLVLDGFAFLPPLIFIVAVVSEVWKWKLPFRIPLHALCAGMLFIWLAKDFSLLPDVARNRTVIREAVKRTQDYPDNPRLKYAAANAYQSLGVRPFQGRRYRFALSCFEKGIDYVNAIPVEERSYDLFGVHAIGYANAATTLWEMDKQQAAKDKMLQGITNEPQNPQMFRKAADFLLGRKLNGEVVKIRDGIKVESLTELTALLHVCLAEKTYDISPDSDDYQGALRATEELVAKCVSQQTSSELAQRFEKVAWLQRWKIFLPKEAKSREDLQQQLLQLSSGAPIDVADLSPEIRSVIAMPPWPVNLARLFPDAGMHRAAFAFAELTCTDDISVNVALGSDDGFALWVNGQEIGRHDHSRPFAERDSLIPATFKKGTNYLLLRVNQNSGPWMFDIQIDAVDGWPAELTWETKLEN